MKMQRIPDYDLSNVKMMMEPRQSMAAEYKHTDKTFSSRLLGLTVSFRWRARIDDNWISTFRQWIIDNETSSTNRPDLIVMGEATIYKLYTLVCCFLLSAFLLV